MNLSSSTMIDLDDSNYIPQPVEISEIDVSQVIDEPVDYISERKFVICESQLDKLLKRMFCPECAYSAYNTCRDNYPFSTTENFIMVNPRRVLVVSHESIISVNKKQNYIVEVPSELNERPKLNLVETM